MKLKLALLILASFVLIGSASATTTTFVAAELETINKLSDQSKKAVNNYQASQQILPTYIMMSIAKPGLDSDATGKALLVKYQNSVKDLTDAINDMNSLMDNKDSSFKKWGSKKSWADFKGGYYIS